MSVRSDPSSDAALALLRSFDADGSGRLQLSEVLALKKALLERHEAGKIQRASDALHRALLEGAEGGKADCIAVRAACGLLSGDAEWDELLRTFAAAHPKFYGGSLLAALHAELSRRDLSRLGDVLTSRGVRSPFDPVRPHTPPLPGDASPGAAVPEAGRRGEPTPLPDDDSRSRGASSRVAVSSLSADGADGGPHASPVRPGSARTTEGPQPSPPRPPTARSPASRSPGPPDYSPPRSGSGSGEQAATEAAGDEGAAGGRGWSGGEGWGEADRAEGSATATGGWRPDEAAEEGGLAGDMADCSSTPTTTPSPAPPLPFDVFAEPHRRGQDSASPPRRFGPRTPSPSPEVSNLSHSDTDQPRLWQPPAAPLPASPPQWQPPQPQASPLGGAPQWQSQPQASPLGGAPQWQSRPCRRAEAIAAPDYVDLPLPGSDARRAFPSPLRTPASSARAEGGDAVHVFRSATLQRPGAAEAAVVSAGGVGSNEQWHDVQTEYSLRHSGHLRSELRSSLLSAELDAVRAALAERGVDWECGPPSPRGEAPPLPRPPPPSSPPASHSDTLPSDPVLRRMLAEQQEVVQSLVRGTPASPRETPPASSSSSSSSSSPAPRRAAAEVEPTDPAPAPSDAPTPAPEPTEAVCVRVPELDREWLRRLPAAERAEVEAAMVRDVASRSVVSPAEMKVAATTAGSICFVVKLPPAAAERMRRALPGHGGVGVPLPGLSDVAAELGGLRPGGVATATVEEPSEPQLRAAGSDGESSAAGSTAADGPDTDAAAPTSREAADPTAEGSSVEAAAEPPAAVAAPPAVGTSDDEAGAAARTPASAAADGDRAAQCGQEAAEDPYAALAEQRAEAACAAAVSAVVCAATSRGSGAVFVAAAAALVSAAVATHRIVADAAFAALSVSRVDAAELMSAAAALSSQLDWDGAAAAFHRHHADFHQGSITAALAEELPPAPLLKLLRLLRSPDIDTGIRPPHHSVSAALAHLLRDALRNCDAEGVHRGLGGVWSAAQWDKVRAAFEEEHPDCHSGDLQRALRCGLQRAELCRAAEIMRARGIDADWADDSGSEKRSRRREASEPPPEAQRAALIADALHAALRGARTDEAAVLESVRRVRTDEDWKLVQACFAARCLADRADDRPVGHYRPLGVLPAALAAQLPAQRLDDVRQTLCAAGVDWYAQPDPAADPPSDGSSDAETEPPPPRRGTAGRTAGREVVVDRADGGDIGLSCKAADGEIVDVLRGSAADRAGLGSYVGWHVRRVNGAPVSTGGEIAVLSASPQPLLRLQLHPHPPPSKELLLPDGSLPLATAGAAGRAHPDERLQYFVPPSRHS